MSEDQKSSSGETPTKVKTILVVEDDEAVGEFVVNALLMETPYQALLATNGKQAIEIAHSLKPNLFLFDYRLPDMNGLEIYDHLHELKEYKDVPAILISANMPKQGMKERSIIALKKPFELDELLQTIETLLLDEK
ncbi:MAG: response regulator [Ktedonobacteraceae bacterium]